MNQPNRLMPMWIAGSLAFLFILLSTRAYSATDVQAQVNELKNSWAVAKYETPKNQQSSVFEDLIKRAEDYTAQNPNSAELHLWTGTVYASYTAVIGKLSALKYAKLSKKHLDTALSLNAGAENGLAHGVIGALYARLPGWPIAFGDSKLAEDHFLSYLQMDPRGMNSNFYYGDFLVEKGQKDLGRDYLNRAKNSKWKDCDRCERGRLQEIESSLLKVNK